jgi:hypothetical protein
LKAIHKKSVSLHQSLNKIRPKKHKVDFFRESPLCSDWKIVMNASFLNEVEDTTGLYRFCADPLVYSALEGNLDILQWFYELETNTFYGPDVLVNISRSAAYRGKIAVTQWIMNYVVKEEKQRKKLIRVILTGGAEGGSLKIVRTYIKYAEDQQIDFNGFNESDDIRRISSQSIVGSALEDSSLRLAQVRNIRSNASMSIIGAAVTGLFCESNSTPSIKRHLHCVKWLFAHKPIDSRIGLQVAISYYAELTKNKSSFVVFLHLFDAYPHEDVWSYREQMISIIQSFRCCLDRKSNELYLNFLRVLSETYGVDIQSVDQNNFSPTIAKKISTLQRDQKDRWDIFDSMRVSSGGEPPDAVLDRNLFDLEGLSMAHCAAVSNRTDLLRYISNHKPENLRDLDKSGRTLKQLCIEKNAINSLEWIKKEDAATRIASCYRRKQAFILKKSALKSILKIQKLWRGYAIRNEIIEMEEERNYEDLEEEGIPQFVNDEKWFQNLRL